MKNMTQYFKGVSILVLSAAMVACGTLMYPERRGQKEGHLDVVVALLDGIGLFFFIIPGVIAYVIDFGDGTIYFPAKDDKRAGIDLRTLKSIKFDTRHYSPDSLKSIIEEETGYPLDWRDKRLRAIKLERKDEVPVFLARAATT
jgi:hypothetical protein